VEGFLGEAEALGAVSGRRRACAGRSSKALEFILTFNRIPFVREVM
jgi:hypothetical protein